jgi:hypothetical protein
MFVLILAAAITVFAGSPSKATIGWTLSLILVSVHLSLSPRYWAVCSVITANVFHSQTLVMLVVQRHLHAWVESDDDPSTNVCGGTEFRMSLNNLEAFGIYCQLFTLVPCGYFLYYDDTTSKIAIGCAMVILAAQVVSL